MLKNLIKYDLKFIYKQLIIFYLIVLFLAIIARLTDISDTSFIIRFIHRFTEGAVFGFSVGMFINASLRLWAKYKLSMYGDESYLTHTLPITKRTLWTAKFLSSIIVVVTSLLLFIVCILIMYLSADTINTISAHASEIWPILITFVIAALGQFCFIMQCGLLGITIGQRFNSYRTVFSVIFGLGIYLLCGGALVGGAFLWSHISPEVNDMLIYGHIFENISTVPKMISAIAGGYAVFITGSYFINYYLLQRGVNVD